MVAENGHADNEPNHRFKRKFSFTQRDGIGESQCLLNKLCGNKVGEGAGRLGEVKWIKPRACERSILKGAMHDEHGPFYTSHRSALPVMAYFLIKN
ncbi:hypothetical protein ADP72_13575 [Serratia plymuthica]|nr:hypothetical protein ADP72_13575 [Serratia plymuthica]